MRIDVYNRIVKRTATAVAVISPVLRMYGTGISTITLLDVVIAGVMALIIAGVMLNNVKIKIEKSEMIFLIILVYIYGNFILQMPQYSVSEFKSVFLRMFRYSYYIIYITVIFRNYYDMKFAIKLYRIAALFATVYLFAQFVCLFVFGFSLRGYVTFLPLMRPGLAEFTENLTANLTARPRSIFGEPSQYAMFVTGYLGLSVWKKEIKDSRAIQIILTIGLVLSASTTAVAMACIIWGSQAWDYVRKIKDFRQGQQWIIWFYIVCIGVILLLFSRTDRFELIIGRLPSSLAGRMNGFFHYQDSLPPINIFHMIFGTGMNLDMLDGWYSGLVKIYYFWGILGLAGYFILILCGILILTKERRRYLEMIFLLGVFTELLVSNWLILFLPFLLCEEKKDEGIPVKLSC